MASTVTRYIAAYDTERSSGGANPPPTCVEACRAIVAKHREHKVPATFFIVGQTLESAPEEYRRLLDDPLFEIASHTYSHKMLRDHPICGPKASPAEMREEIFRGKEVVERVFRGRTCVGLRPGCSFVEGLRGAPEVLTLVKKAGYRYVSSAAWGPDYSLPAPLDQAFDYAEDGFPELREYPCHGWHENLLKGNNKVFGGRFAGPLRVLAFPSLYPEAVPRDFVKTPAEEFRYNNKVFIDHATGRGLGYVTLIWHPWSLGWFDPSMEMLEMTFRYVKEKGLRATTFEEMHRETGGRTR